jgi:hypothetical protein
VKALVEEAEAAVAARDDDGFLDLKVLGAVRVVLIG